MLTSFFLQLVLSLTALNNVLGQSECEKPATPFDSISDAIQYYCQNNIPTDKFNVSCLLESCPALCGVCPLFCNGSVNQEALNNAVSILNLCISQDRLICGINMTHHPLAQIGWTTKELIPDCQVNGSVYLNPGTGFLNNVSKAKFCVKHNDDPNGPITLVIRVSDITSEAHYNCDFAVSPKTLLHSSICAVPLFKLFFSIFGITPSSNSLNFPNMISSYQLDANSTVSIDPSAKPFNIHISNYEFGLNGTFSNFVNRKGVALDKNIVKLFNQGMNCFFQDSNIATTIIYFLSSYAALGLQAAQLNCP